MKQDYFIYAKKQYMKREEIIKTFGQLDRIAEVGVLRGNYAKRLLEVNPKELHLIDPWQHFGKAVYNDYLDKDQEGWDKTYEYVVKRFSGNPAVKIHRQESVEASTMFPNDYFDLVYIDANHAFDFVLQDIRAWLPKVKRGGWIGGHDFESEGVYKAVAQAFGITKPWQGEVYDLQLGALKITTEYEEGQKRKPLQVKSWFIQKV
jgi:hypothetical protein